MRRGSKSVLLVILALPAFARAQTPPTLRVDGLDGKSIALRASDLDAMAREKAEVADDKGNRAIYEGVPVIAILQRVGAPSGKNLHGKNLTLYLLVSASDGYHAVYALAELDPGFTDRHVLLVHKRDGKALSPIEGPFRIIAPREKRHARWVRSLTALSLKNAE